MRTTITLDRDVEALIRRAMAERGLGFKEVVNDALRHALAGRPAGHAYRVSARDLGPASVPLEKALQLAASLEDEETLRETSLRR